MHPDAATRSSSQCRGRIEKAEFDAVTIRQCTDHMATVDALVHFDIDCLLYDTSSVGVEGGQLDKLDIQTQCSDHSGFVQLFEET